MSDYPECDKLAEASKLTQPIGEFLDWLQGQGVQLMTYREDLSDVHPTDPECTVRRDSDNPAPCDQMGDMGDDAKPRAWWRRHCLHWQGHADVLDEGVGTTDNPDHCCRCGKGREHTITTRGWVHEQRGIEQLLADWAAIDLKKVDAERRQMLASLREANAAKEA